MMLAKEWQPTANAELAQIRSLLPAITSPHLSLLGV